MITLFKNNSTKWGKCWHIEVIDPVHMYSRNMTGTQTSNLYLDRNIPGLFSTAMRKEERRG